MKWLSALWVGLRQWVREPRVLWRSKPGLSPRVSIQIQRGLPAAAFLLVLAWTVIFPSPVAMMSAVALGGLLVVCLWWAIRMARGVRAERRLRFSAMQVGDELEEQVSLVNATPLPVIWAEFRDQSNLPGYSVTSARAADPSSQIRWRVRTVCARRGIFRLGPWELRIGDPFGLFLVRQVYAEQQEILVYPPLAELPQRLLPHHGAYGEHHPLNQPLPAETIVVSSVRPFTPGDPLHHLHWRTFARRDAPFVKVFAPEAASKVWLLPDFDAQVHYTREAVKEDHPESAALAPLLRSSLETMVTVTASLAADLLQQRLAVGLLATGAPPQVVAPRQGQPHLWSILQALAPLEPVSGAGLPQAIQQVQALLRGDDLLIVITPSTSADWIASLRRLARPGGGSRAVVMLLDPRSFGGTRSPETLYNVLVAQSVAARVLRAEDVRLISGSYGELRRWEFKVTGSGRAVASQTPRLSAVVAGQSSPWQER